MQSLIDYMASIPPDSKAGLSEYFQDAFGALHESETNALMQISEWRAYEEDDIIFSEAKPADYFFVLLKGTVHMTFTHKINLRVSPGMIFGDWAFLNKTTRLATAKALSSVEVAAIPNAQMINPQSLDAKVSLKVVMHLASGLVKRLLSASQISTESLLRQGESAHVEFKSTLRKNLYTGKNDPAIERAALKTIAAFLNTDGGILLIGVNDEGAPIGLSHDGFANEDKLFLHLNQLLTDRLGLEALQDVCHSLSQFGQAQVLRIDCTPAPRPVFFKEGDSESFFVRQGPRTVALSIKDAIQYIQQRF